MPKIEVTVELYRADNKSKKVFDMDSEKWAKMSQDEKDMAVLSMVEQRMILWDYKVLE